MKKKELNPVLMTEDDYRALKPFAGNTYKGSELSLARELERAIIVHKEAFPKHAIRLNSMVSLVERKTKKVVSFTIVLPKYADIKEGKISATSLIAVAIIGFRKGEEVRCKLPGGATYFRIEEVVNQPLA
jgi:regulator of nucleoside diphosphate kinase